MTAKHADGETVWIDDALPEGASLLGNDSFFWVGSEPSPASGSQAYQSSLIAGIAEHGFNWVWGSAQLNVVATDVLFVDVYLDVSDPPEQVMVSFNVDGSWEHRAYWGANKIHHGVDGTPSRRYLGPIPSAGEWVRLEIPAESVGITDGALRGMALSRFSEMPSRITWDTTGLISGGPADPPPDDPGDPEPPDPPDLPSGAVVWFDDELPQGASALGGVAWNWTNSDPEPFSGAYVHASTAQAGLNAHGFNWTWDTAQLALDAGDTFFTHVYLDPANPPQQLILSFKTAGPDGSWEQRAYWGENHINHGTSGPNSHHFMGPLPGAGSWVRLEVPADAVGLTGKRLEGMTFDAYGVEENRVAWDVSGKIEATVTQPPDSGEPPMAQPAPSVVNYVNLQVPRPGDHALQILSPSLLELVLINTKDPNPARVGMWDWVTDDYEFIAPDLSKITVLVDESSVEISNIGFKRRPLYAPLEAWAPVIGNYLYLEIAGTISENQTVNVLNPDGSLWSSEFEFEAVAHPLRYNPAIHVNQEGYMPTFPKTAAIGYYLGSLGEMDIPIGDGFHLVDASTGTMAFEGSLTLRSDIGYTYTPTPYQYVYEADFSEFVPEDAGEYYLVVPGMGASLPFLIHDGIGMTYTRTFSLGLYHQRSGSPNTLPFTRFTHQGGHTDPASVPVEDAPPYTNTWMLIRNNATQTSANPPQTAPVLTSPESQLYPFVNDGTVDVSGGYFEAANYSKVTWNSAQIVHTLLHAIDAFPGVDELDNLGIPESDDGISDVLQAAVWEADFIAKMQDADGGFYYAVHPINRLYENNVLPDAGDPQVVWPKNTASTAAAVAALAQAASSPLLNSIYPEKSALYLQRAELGWDFLLDAIGTYGWEGSYQAIMHFGHAFTHDDDLAWAACELYLATGDPSYLAALESWFPDPSDPNTFRWGWWRLFGSYGNVIRSYAAAVVSGRMPVEGINDDYHAKCVTVLLDHADQQLMWSQHNAYGTSFPDPTKRVLGAGWYFSSVQAFDLAVAHQFDPNPQYVDAILRNLNYETGVNPVNVSYITGLGWKRQRQVVDQYSSNDRRILPKTGIPIGNIQTGFLWTFTYGGELTWISFPADGAQTAPYPYYDRWADFWNVATEASSTDIARSLPVAAWLASQSSLLYQDWQATGASILVQTESPIVNTPVTVEVVVAENDLSGARIVWEAQDQEPAYGDVSDLTYTFVPAEEGVHWIEAEVQWPDGRRAFAVGSLTVAP